MTTPHHDWHDALRAAAHLGISPDVFWRLSLREWLALVHTGQAHAPLSRTQLSDLMARFPDSKGERNTVGDKNHTGE